MKNGLLAIVAFDPKNVSEARLTTSLDRLKQMFPALQEIRVSKKCAETVVNSWAASNNVEMTCGRLANETNRPAVLLAFKGHYRLMNSVTNALTFRMS